MGRRDRGFEEAADGALVGDAFAGGCGADGGQEGAGETHVEALVFGLELEADGVEGGEVELGEVGGGDEGQRTCRGSVATRVRLTLRVTHDAFADPASRGGQPDALGLDR